MSERSSLLFLLYQHHNQKSVPDSEGRRGSGVDARERRSDQSQHSKTIELMSSSRIPKGIYSALALDNGETPLVCWQCLKSYEEKSVRTRNLVLNIALAPLTNTYALGNETSPGFVVLTNQRLVFVESGMVPGKRSYAWGGAIPLEHITAISTNGELVVDAKSMGWRWCIRKLMIVGFPGVGISPATVADLLRDAVKLRKLEIGQEKRDRRRRIESFGIERRRRRI